MRKSVLSDTTAIEDPGLLEIEAWGRWFRDAHRQRLEAEPMAAANRQCALDEIDRLTEAITTRMRDDYLARRGPR